MSHLLQQVHAAATVYRNFITTASMQIGPIDRLGLFGYRTGVLESEVIKPLVLCLLDPEQQSVPAGADGVDTVTARLDRPPPHQLRQLGESSPPCGAPRPW